jgi:hypothetical protein
LVSSEDVKKVTNRQKTLPCKLQLIFLWIYTTCMTAQDKIPGF